MAAIQRETSRFKAQASAYTQRRELTGAVRSSRCVILHATHTGTAAAQLAQYLADDLRVTPSPIHRNPGGLVVCSYRYPGVAVAMAGRVASEWDATGAAPSGAVAYRTMNEANVDLEHCRIMFTSHRQLIDDMARGITSKYSVVIVQDADDGAMETDLLVALLRASFATVQEGAVPGAPVPVGEAEGAGTGAGAGAGAGAGGAGAGAAGGGAMVDHTIATMHAVLCARSEGTAERLRRYVCAGCLRFASPSAKP